MASHDAAQPASDLIYRLRALAMGAAVLHVGAHPDDEDSGTMAYLSRGLGVRTVYWSATRGEGGQNRQGSERGEALGIVRTWESLEARTIDGSEVLYGPFFDFGFSKSAEAAFSKWDREDLVRELVRAIRTVQPLVVISRWSGGPADGHGQHQAVGAAVAEAFEAAGDAVRFDELGLPPWRARKLYRSTLGDWQPGEDVTLGRRMPELEGDGVVRIDTGELEPVSGRTYQELAALGRNRHRSQAMSELPERGAFSVYYRLERSLVETRGPDRGLLDGLDPTLTGLAGDLGHDGVAVALAEARSHAEEAARAFHPRDPAEAGRSVLRGLTPLRAAVSLLDGEEGAARAVGAALERKVGAFEDAAARCFGIRVEALTDPRRVVPGDAVHVTARVWCPDRERVEGVELHLRVPPGWASRATAAPEPDEDGPVRQRAFEVAVPEDAEVSAPYWLRAPREGYRYRWPQDAPGGLPFDPPLVAATAEIAIDGERLRLEAPGVRRETFMGGFRELPLAVLPAMALQPREDRVILPVEAEDREIELQLSVRATREQGAKGELVPTGPEGWQIVPPDASLLFPRGGDSRTLRFDLRIPGASTPGTYRVAYDLVTDQRRRGLVVQPVWHGASGVRRPPDETTCVAEAFVTSPAEISVDLVDVDVVRTLRYGYVQGVDEQVLPALSRFGLELGVLSDEELAYADLGAFDAIVVGPNAYVMRDAVRAAAGRLLEFAERGGTLVVQYQAYAYQAEGLAPYPFRYHQPHGRVTFPDAPVTVLEPAHPVLHLPNAIAQGDFEGWIHDRGLYFWGEWDRRYEAILECHDPGEGAQRGGLLVAGYGHGTYAYVGYSLFRQVPAGVPGAIRLFANLLGLAEARILERARRARKVELFSFMSDEQLHDVVRLMSERWFDDGELLAREGTIGSELFLIVDGEVEILKEGARHTVHVAGEGEAVGELAVLADTPRSASLRSRGGAKVLSMRGDHFRRLLREHRDLADGLIRMLATRLAESDR